MQPPIIATQADYYVPLLRLLAESPGGETSAHDAVRGFWERYSDRIAPEHLEPLESGPDERKWENYVRWARKTLKDIGYLEMPRRGIWKLSDEGRAWLEKNPDAHHLDSTGVRRGPRSPRSRSASSSVPVQSPPGITLDMLEQTKQMMGEELFRQLWGALYDQLLTAERAKAITQVGDRDLLQAARQQVRQIQDYLQGRNSNRPSSEQLCDWIHFCYQFSLFREAAALFTLVNPDDVNPWYLERTRKIAVTCRSRL
jgi:hypothetical protein